MARGVLKSLRSGRDAVVVVLEGNVRAGAKALLRLRGSEFRGRVVRVRGNGKVVVRFKRGLPGQALGEEVEILD